MLTIRLTRRGKKNQPFFKIVVIDKRRSSKGGRAVEEVGYINPLTKKNSLEKERILYWIKNGAKPSPRVHNLLVAEKVIDAKKINVFNIKKGKENISAMAAPAPAVSEKTAEKPAETPAAETPKEEPKAEVKKEETPAN